MTQIGSRPINVIIGYYKNSTHPTGAPEDQARVQINFMFPQKPKG